MISGTVFVGADLLREKGKADRQQHLRFEAVLLDAEGVATLEEGADVESHFALGARNVRLGRPNAQPAARGQVFQDRILESATSSTDNSQL